MSEPSVDSRALVDTIRAAMQTRGWTGTDLAQAAGVHENTVYAWMRGTTSPRLDVLFRVLPVLGLRLDVVPEGDGAGQPPEADS